MKILLLGEYSNLHATLAKGLRQLGHQVLVVSDGTNIYNYERDISLYRKGPDRWASLKYAAKLATVLPRLRGFDIVQLINPDFISLKANRQLPIYHYLRHHNGAMVLGAFGNDWQWVKRGLHDRIFRYGDFNIGNTLRTSAYTQRVIKEWEHSDKGALSQYIANDCDCIVSCLYEYQLCYESDYPSKTHFIPLPIIPKTIDKQDTNHGMEGGKIRFFLGIKEELKEYKGTDLFLEALNKLKATYPDRCTMTVVRDLPFQKYVQMMKQHDVILDQAYSYTPAMNALEAMSHGLICVGGGEPENYEIIHETELRPIINVLPHPDDIYRQLELLLLHPERLPELKRQSMAYVERHHDYIKVAKQYEQLYQTTLTNAALPPLAKQEQQPAAI